MSDVGLRHVQKASKQQTNQSINQFKHIYLVPHDKNQSEAWNGSAKIILIHQIQP